MINFAAMNLGENIFGGILTLRRIFGETFKNWANFSEIRSHFLQILFISKCVFT